MTDVIEVSYTGDLLAHRRCPRAWAYEKHIGMHPYEHIQAMEGYLVHHAMEWLSKHYREGGQHATRLELEQQLQQYFGILLGQGHPHDLRQQGINNCPGCRPPVPQRPAPAGSQGRR